PRGRTPFPTRRSSDLGARGDSLVEVVLGLKEGDEVVASATYLLDSESNLAAAMQGLMLQMGMGLDMGRMNRPAKAPSPAPPAPRSEEHTSELQSRFDL